MRPILSPQERAYVDIVEPYLKYSRDGFYIPDSAPEEVKHASAELKKINAERRRRKMLEELED